MSQLASAGQLPAVDVPFITAHQDNINGVISSLKGIASRLERFAQLTANIPEIQQSEPDQLESVVRLVIIELRHSKLLHAFRVARQALRQTQDVLADNEWLSTLDVAYDLMIYASMLDQGKEINFWQFGQISPQDWALHRQLGVFGSDMPPVVQEQRILLPNEGNSLQDMGPSHTLAGYMSSIVMTIAVALDEAHEASRRGIAFTESLIALQNEGKVWLGAVEEQRLRKPLGDLLSPSSPFSLSPYTFTTGCN
ncbi:MAG: hypothetical protein J0L97_06935 [Alphaproteobacteria bacterium]|nr:hypothetical protein [Alphaproteobacteria bacterium]